MTSDPIATHRTPAQLVWTLAIVGALLAGPMLYAALAIPAGTFGRELTRWVIIASGLGLLLWAYAAEKVRTLVFDDRIEKEGVFGRRVLLWRDIAGFRKTQPQGYICLIPDKPSTQPMRVSSDVRNYANRATWIDKLIDLDEADRKILARAVMKNPHFGATDNERAAFVRQARKSIVALAFAGLAVVVWSLIWPEPRPAVVAALIMLPLLSVAVAARVRPAIRVLESERGGRELDLFLALAIPSCTLLLMAEVGARLVERPPFAAMLAAGVIIAAILAWIDPLIRRRWLELVVLATVGYCYVHGAAMEINTIFDRAAPSRIEVAIREKYVDGGYFEHRHLVVSPWVDGGEQHHVIVPADLYDAVRVGDRICIDVHPGALDWRWYDVAQCT